MADKSESESGINVGLCKQMQELDVNNHSTAEDDIKNESETKNDTNYEKTELCCSIDIRNEDVKLPECFKGKLAFVLHNVFSKEECKDYINKTEKMGYDEAMVNVGGGRQMMMKDVRNNTRCMWDSVEEAQRIWDRIKCFVPETWKGRKVLGLNERLRFLKYDPGEYFAPHMDGSYVRDNGEKSYITIQLYLNEGFKGGSTTFMNYAGGELSEVVPETGMILVFQHDIMHEGSKLIKGRKYTMRTDVMYEPGRIVTDKD